MANETIKQITSGGVTRDVEDAAARQAAAAAYQKPADGIPKTDLAQSVRTSLGLADTALQQSDKTALQAAITSLQNALNTLIGGGNVQGAIDTFNEVVAFLNGIDTSDPTLSNQLLALNNAITNLGNSLATVATSGSYNDLSNKPTILSQQQVAGMIEDAIEDLPTGDIPTKVSDLENDEGYITAEEVGEIVATTGDIAIVETSDYVDIMIYSPEMSVKLGGNEVSSLAFFSDPTQQESLSLAISGSHLKANIVATLEGTDANKFSISGSPITPMGGAASGTLTVAYTGTTAAGQSANATLKLTCGDLVKTISLHYAYASGPFISVNPATLSFNAGTGSTETKTLAISASQLTGDVVVSVPSGSGFQVRATESGTYGNSVTVAKADAEAGKTIYVKYTAGSSAATASLTVASTGATSRTVALSGAVSTITVSKNSMTFSTDQGVAVTDTFTVEGANLNEDISIVASGTGFSVSPNTIAHSNGSVASTTVTVTFSPTAAGAHSGSISIQSSGATATVTLSGSAAAAAAMDANGKIKKDGLCYIAKSDGNGGFLDDVTLYNAHYTTSVDSASGKYSGELIIPSTFTALKNGVPTTFTVKAIATAAFQGNDAITLIKIPDTCTSAPANMCLNCTGLKFLHTGGITATTYGFARNCTALETLVLGNGMIRTNGNSSFNSDSAVTKVVFGENLICFAHILKWDYMRSATSIVCLGQTPPLANESSSTSNSINSVASIDLFVPVGKTNDYKNADDPTYHKIWENAKSITEGVPTWYTELQDEGLL